MKIGRVYFIWIPPTSLFINKAGASDLENIGQKAFYLINFNAPVVPSLKVALTI
jgi:hypothetical protein